MVAGAQTGNFISETLAHPQHRARNFIVELDHPLVGAVRSMGNPVNMSATPVNYRLAPPMLGQHTGEILSELGYDEAAIGALRTNKVI